MNEEKRRQKSEQAGRALALRPADGSAQVKTAVSPTNPGLVDLLLACPDKHWFVPVPSESTGDLPPPFSSPAETPP